MTSAIIARTIHAAPRVTTVEAALAVLARGRVSDADDEKTTSATSTAVAKKSSTKASQLLWPISGMWKPRWKSAP